jgi:hypothetical protein
MVVPRKTIPKVMGFDLQKKWKEDQSLKLQATSLKLFQRLFKGHQYFSVYSYFPCKRRVVGLAQPTCSLYSLRLVAETTLLE